MIDLFFKNNTKKKNMMNNSIFDRKISWFSSMFDREPKEITLGEFLAMGDKYREQIERLRTLINKTERNAIKYNLPQATISGVFSGGRKAENLVQHSGLICIDIDKKDNPAVPDFDKLIDNELSKLEEVAYASRSVGGKGYFVIIPLQYPKQHRAQFEQLRIDFGKKGIVIDHACSDVCRLRCLSYDENPYVNENAAPYNGVYRKPKPTPCPFCHRKHADDTDERVYECCKYIARNHIDMTENYADWISIGLALATLGEEGREYYHIVSRQNAKYNEHETDKKFDGFLRSSSRITIGTFLHYCKMHHVL